MKRLTMLLIAVVLTVPAFAHADEEQKPKVEYRYCFAKFAPRDGGACVGQSTGKLSSRIGDKIEARTCQLPDNATNTKKLLEDIFPDIEFTILDYGSQVCELDKTYLIGKDCVPGALNAGSGRDIYDSLEPLVDTTEDEILYCCRIKLIHVMPPSRPEISGSSFELSGAFRHVLHDSSGGRSGGGMTLGHVIRYDLGRGLVPWFMGPADIVNISSADFVE